MRLSIRETTLADLAALGRLWNVGFPEGLGVDDDGLHDWFERLQASRRAHHFVIREADVGFGPSDWRRRRVTPA